MSTAHDATPSILSEPMSWRISYAEIGALAQVKRPVVTTWARRHPDFPRPVHHDGTRPLFDGREVLDWLLATGRGNVDARQLRAELALHTLAAWGERLPGTALVDTLTSLVCLRRHDDQPLAADGWPELAARARYFDEEDTFFTREIEAAAQAGAHLDGLPAVADALVETAYSPTEPFTWILDARRRLGAHHLAEGSVTSAMTQCIARLSGIEEMAESRVIGIPYVRTGDLLTALRDKDVTDTGHLYQACDPDPSLVRLVRRRALVHDIAEYELDISEGDELPIEAFDAPDLVTAVLPYEAGENRDPLVALERIQALTDLLADGRMAVVLGPADALAQVLPPGGEADRLRRSLLTAGLVKAVVNLPGGVMPYRPAYRTALWVLHRTPQGQRRGRVLLIDLSAQDLTRRILDTLCEDVHIWRTANWDDDGRHEPRHGAILPIQVLDDRPGIAFTPQHRSHASRYTSAVIDRPALISELEVRLSRLTDAAHRQHDQRQELRTHAALRPADRPIRRITVTRLIKERRLRKLPGHRIDTEHLRPEGRYDVLTPAEITGTAPVGTHRIDRAVLMKTYEHAQFTEPGDVVITVTPRFGVYVDEEGLSVVAYPARVLRVRSDAERPLRPRVLAALLRAAAAEHRRASGAVRAARRIEEMAIPDLEPDEVARCDALLLEIAQRAALLRAQAAALEDLSELTAAGLSDGTLTILAPDFPSHAL
ncbi:N-6 DNA methylase [Streptomyces sp. NPDC005955]|uniref:N-6 DNA methylase n=1 Tax=Streptomyces sp. NPDC005955 TaxID=3364738 RepID=UPI00368D99D5